MTASYRHQVARAIGGVVIRSPTTYFWFGAPLGDLSAPVKRLIPPETARDYLLFHLQTTLYRGLYCPGRVLTSLPPRLQPAPGWSSYVAGLSAANAGHGWMQPGWEIAGRDGDALLAHRDGLTVRVAPEDCADGGSMGPGALVSLRMPKEYLGLSPGFYTAVGDVGLDGTEPRVRLYWNLRPAGAACLVRAVTTSLNEMRLPFSLKVLNDPTSFRRTDAGILYIRKSDFSAASPVIQDTYLSLAPHLKAGTPAFTNRLAPGLGLAEDPPGEESFGQHRCRLLAGGIIRAHERRARSSSDKLAAVEERFLEAGFTLDRPYLQPGSEEYPTRWQT